jgi:hypothetical protein
MAKLKAKLTTVSGPDKEKVVLKIKRLSPFWTETTVKGTGAAKADPSAKPAAEPKADKKPKSPPKPKAEKKDKPS